MQFEIDGVTFNLTMEKDSNGKYTVLASTETPFCRDVAYMTTVDADTKDELTTAFKNKAVTGSYDETYYHLTLLYGDKSLVLYYDDEDVHEPSDFAAKLKNYHELKNDMVALRRDFEKLQAMYNNFVNTMLAV